jgi:hypothetical protein
MDLSHKLVRFARDYRAGMQPLTAGSFQPSHKPANTNGELSFMLIEYGILPPGTLFHSEKTSTGIRQRRFLNACRL